MAKKRNKPAEGEEKPLYERLSDTAQELFGDSAPCEVRHWTPTGILLLDLAINRGLPGGKLTEIYGREGSGKTALALSIVRHAQAAGGVGVWLDPESRLSISLAEDIVGVRRDVGFVYRQPRWAEECLDAIEQFAIQARDSVLPTVIVLDSVAALVPKVQSLAEVEVQDGKGSIGKQAALLSWFFARGILREIAGSNVHLVFLNQVRAALNINGPARFHGPQYTTPGGYAVGYYSTVRMEVGQVGLEGEKDLRTGAMVEVKLTKNSVGPPHRHVRFPFYFHPLGPILGFDDVTSQLVYLAGQGVLKKSGAFYEMDAPGGRIKAYMSQWCAKVRADADLRKFVRDLVILAFQQEHGLVASDVPEVQA